MARLLLGSNGMFQILMTYYYWADDASWAVPIWARIFETIRARRRKPAPEAGRALVDAPQELNSARTEFGSYYPHHA